MNAYLPASLDTEANPQQKDAEMMLMLVLYASMCRLMLCRLGIYQQQLPMYASNSELLFGFLPLRIRPVSLKYVQEEKNLLLDFQSETKPNRQTNNKTNKRGIYQINQSINQLCNHLLRPSPNTRGFLLFVEESVEQENTWTWTFPPVATEECYRHNNNNQLSYLAWPVLTSYGDILFRLVASLHFLLGQLLRCCRDLVFLHIVRSSGGLLRNSLSRLRLRLRLGGLLLA